MRLQLRGSSAPINVGDYRRKARAALPGMVWAYVEGGAEDEATLARNRESFTRLSLRQRALTGPGEPTVSIDLEGEALALPAIAAPTGLNALSDWRGDLAVARGAERAGTRMVLSTASSYSMEEVADASAERHWFQLYPWRDKQLTGSLIERARSAGYGALVLTVDVGAVGNRERERRSGAGFPPVLTPARALDALRRPRWVWGTLRHRRYSLGNLEAGPGMAAGGRSSEAMQRNISISRLCWDDLAWIRDRWGLPLYLKGILDPDDARLAIEHGVDGIIVSNHGGRQLDGSISSLEALAEIAPVVDRRVRVLVDGGIRRGTDLVKALCLGADACLLGRPVVYGLAVRGERGVADVFGILREELIRALTLMGCPGVGALGPDWLHAAEGIE